MTVATSLSPVLERFSRALGARSVAAAESCTSGLLMAALADIADATERFDGGGVAYDSDGKTDVLHVGREVVREHGVVSAECALAMARGVREMFDTDSASRSPGSPAPRRRRASRSASRSWRSQAARPRP